MSAQRAPFGRNRRGVAAMEFAMIAPFLVALVLSIIEISLRVRAADSFQRFLQQSGDYFSREDQLFTTDIDAMYAAVPDIMAPLDTTGRVDFDVASIGYIPDGSPELLWRRYRGEAPSDIDIASMNGLGAPGESVIRVGATFRYDTPVSALLGYDGMTLKSSVVYRPRVTRLIAIDGRVHDEGANWASDGASTAATTTDTTEP